MNGRKHSPEEALLLEQFSESELEELTPGEVRLLAALEYEELPELSLAETRQLEREYRDDFIRRITRVDDIDERVIHPESEVVAQSRSTNTMLGHAQELDGQQALYEPVVTEVANDEPVPLGDSEHQSARQSSKHRGRFSKIWKAALVLAL